MSEKLACKFCSKTFTSDEGLQMHIKAKHGEHLPKKRKPLPMKKIRNSIIILLIVAMITYAVVGFVTASKKNAEFAQCLGDEGVIMYGADWCAACGEQKRIFRGHFDKIEYVECSLPGGQQTPQCIDAGIQSYPTWVFPDGERSVGVLSLRQLSQYSTCEY